VPNDILIGILLALAVIAVAAAAVTVYLRMRPTRIASPHKNAPVGNASASHPSGDTGSRARSAVATSPRSATSVLSPAS
jgi:hypothetical protein